MLKNKIVVLLYIIMQVKQTLSYEIIKHLGEHFSYLQDVYKTSKNDLKNSSHPGGRQIPSEKNKIEEVDSTEVLSLPVKDMN